MPESRRLPEINMPTPSERNGGELHEINDVVEAVGGAMQFMRDPLECSNPGVTVVECDPGWTGKEHDYSGQSRKTCTSSSRERGPSLRWGNRSVRSGETRSESTRTRRQFHNGDEESLFVLVGAP